MSAPGFSMDDFEYKFEDCKELQDLLGAIEQRQGQTSEDLMSGMRLDNAPDGTLSVPLQFQTQLQFQPHQPHQPGVQSFSMPAPSEQTMAPTFGQFSGISLTPGTSQTPSFGAINTSSGLPLQMQRHSFDGAIGLQHQQYSSIPGTTVVSGQMPAQMVMFPAGQAGGTLGQGSVVVLPNGVSYNVAGSGNLTFASMMTQQGGVMPQATSSAAGGSASRGAAKEGPLDKVSHSSVEKLRRDRINMLIEELRELVPPSASSNKLDGLESRRPKHVVLADTITLLRNLKISQQAAQMQQPPVEVKAEPSQTHSPRPHRASSGAAHMDGVRQTSSGTVGSGSDQDEADDMTAAPQLPVIPMQPNMNRGVSVEKGPDCMYVQVKCRDRRGLLSDIINALHSLPLEIRTASVTTTTDGSVRDVFEVTPDSSEMVPEQVQNMVHDALFQPGAPLDHKRARGVQA